jgi:hypothetical protein
VEKTGENGDDAARIAGFLLEVEKLKPSLHGHLDHAEKLLFSEGRLVIVSPPGDPWLANALQRGNNRQVLEQALAAVWGPGVSWRLMEGSGKRETSTEIPSVKLELVAENPTVQTILDIFGGRVEKVEEHGSIREE